MSLSLSEKAFNPYGIRAAQNKSRNQEMKPYCPGAGGA